MGKYEFMLTVLTGFLVFIVIVKAVVGIFGSAPSSNFLEWMGLLIAFNALRQIVRGR